MERSERVFVSEENYRREFREGFQRGPLNLYSF